VLYTCILFHNYKPSTTQNKNKKPETNNRQYKHSPSFKSQTVVIGFKTRFKSSKSLSLSDVQGQIVPELWSCYCKCSFASAFQLHPRDNYLKKGTWYIPHAHNCPDMQTNINAFIYNFLCFSRDLRFSDPLLLVIHLR